MTLEIKQNYDELDKLILREFPQPIAVNYRRLLEMNDWQKKVEHGLRVFEFGLRTMALVLISQYLIKDIYRVNDPFLTKLLLEKLPGGASLGTWQQLFFSCLKAYKEKRNLLFIPELYDFYWDSKDKGMHQPRKGIEDSFTRLVQIRNDLAHRLGPFSQEGWEDLYREVILHLRTVLGMFTFLQKYELIRIIEIHNGFYEYMICKGLDACVMDDLPIATSNLEVGWFYLTKNKKSFLQLHPLLIFWEDVDPSIPDKNELKKIPDAAIYESFTKETVSYLATILWKVVRNRKTVGDFIHLLYYNLQDAKTTWRRVPRLSWPLFKDISSEISEAQLSATKGKYNRELYVQRENLKEEFQVFMRSRQNCFVLLGHSGIGKSCFYISLLDDYKNNDEICLLFIDGSRIEGDKRLEETLTSEFQRKLKFLRNGRDVSIDDILFELSKIEGIQEKRVLIILDSVNENSRANDLLLRIDSMVRDNPFPWLKIALSSRPEAWQVMLQNIKNLTTDRYYMGEPGVIGFKLEQFEFQELSEAYEKYSKENDIETKFDFIPPRVKQVLSDPLALKLVTEIYSGGNIPPYLRTAKIISDYLNMLQKNKILVAQDITFLEQELLPLMISEGVYTNNIPAEKINEAITTDNQKLRELIMSDDLLSNGKRVNSSFFGLADTEILTLRGDSLRYEMGFKYERFYEYFAGNRIYEMNKAKLNKAEAYSLVMQETREKVFLWGAIKLAILKEFASNSDNGKKLIVKLAQNNDAVTRDIIVAIIVDIGQEKLSSAEWVLKELSQLGKKTFIFRFRMYVRSIRDIVRLSRGLEPHAPNGPDLARSLVPVISGQLGIYEYLIKSATDPSYIVRKETISTIYFIWLSKKAEGKIDNAFIPIKNLADNVFKNNRNIPNIYTLLCLFEITTKLVINYLMIDSESVSPLLSIWHDVLTRLPLIFPSQNTFTGKIKNIIRQKILLSFLGSRIKHLIKISLNEGHPINLGVLEKWYQLPDLDKQEWKSNVKYADLKQYNIGDIREKLIQMSSDSRPLFAIVLAMILPLHAMNEFNEVMAVMDEMVKTGNNLSKNVALRSYEVLGELSSNQPERLAIVLTRCREVALDLWKNKENVFWEKRSDAVSFPIYLDMLSGGEGPITFAYDLVNSIPEDLPPKGKRERFREVVHAFGDISDRSVDRELATLSKWFSVEDKEIKNEIINALSKLFVVYPGRVSECLSRNPNASELLHIVELKAISDYSRGAAAQEAGGILYVLFSNPRIRKDWMEFLLYDIGESKNFTIATQKAADRIIRFLAEQ